LISVLGKGFLLGNGGMLSGSGFAGLED